MIPASFNSVNIICNDYWQFYELLLDDKLSMFIISPSIKIPFLANGNTKLFSTSNLQYLLMKLIYLFELETAFFIFVT